MKRLLSILILLMLCGAQALAQKPGDRSADVVRIEGKEYYLHTVGQGETLYSLSKLYEVPIGEIMADNGLTPQDLKAGQVIRVRCAEVPKINMPTRRMARTFSEHVVAKGETAYSIARRYSISINTLIQDNPGLDPTKLDLGQTLRIRKSEMGETSPDDILNQIDGYADALNAVSDGYIYHVVDIGETLFSISRQYDVARDVITANNDVAGGLKAGAIIKIPVDPQAKKVLIANRAEEEASEQHSEESPEAQPDRQEYYGGGVHNYIPAGSINVALLLPLSTEKGARSSFVEFYQGALMAIEEFKEKNFSVNVTLYDTGRSAETVASLVRQPEFSNTDIIIGPVYEECLPPVMDFARMHGIPVISPLGVMEEAYGRFFYQLSPAADTKYEKAGEIFDGNKNIVLITSDNNDNELEREIVALLGGMEYQRIVYTKGTPSDYIDSLLVRGDRENLFVVLAADEVGVDLILAAISSVQNNRQARSIRTSPISVFGHSRWTRYRNLEKNLLFKLNVSYLTTYHADRTSPAVYEFDKRYVTAYKEIPTLYAYRGYDAAMLSLGALTTNPGMDFGDRLNITPKPLQTEYGFRRLENGNTRNTSWALVRYGSDYTVTVK